MTADANAKLYAISQIDGNGRTFSRLCRVIQQRHLVNLITSPSSLSLIRRLQREWDMYILVMDSFGAYLADHF